MEHINLTEYGKIISSEEYILDKEKAVVSLFTYIGKDKETTYTKGNLKIEADFNDDKGKYYYTRIIHPSKGMKNKSAKIEFTGKEITTVDRYINYMNNVISKNKALPAKVYRYDSAKIKTEDDYSIEITFGDIDIVIGPFSKDSDVLVDGNQAIVSVDNSVSSVYIFYKNGYKIVEFENGLPCTSTNVDFTSSDGSKDVVSSKISQYSGELSKVINNMHLPKDLDYNNNNTHIEFEYDKYGIVQNVTDDNIIYEECYFEDGNIDTVMSLHPLYYNEFDSSIHYAPDIYCLEQLEFNYEDEKYTRYSKYICKVDEDKINKLKQDMNEKKSLGYPVLDLM